MKYFRTLLWTVAVFCLSTYTMASMFVPDASSRALAQSEKDQIIGAWGFCQRCPTTATACPGIPGCVWGIDCVTWRQDISSPWTCQPRTNRKGCDDPTDNYLECVWAVKFWCGEGSVNSCGNEVFLQCQSTWVPFNGYPCALEPDELCEDIALPETPCRKDCV